MPADLRIGHGWDMHRLTTDATSDPGKARPLIIGGVSADARTPEGASFLLVAHSDGDVLYHAVTDALLGAIKGPDIGQLFPDTALENTARNSEVFLAEAARRIAAAGWRLANLDATVIAERLKIAPIKDRIIANLARVLALHESQVNVKGKTHERVDAVGEDRAIEAHCVVLLTR
ncbi:MAG: 2-C-methyl-D-erythritol 2,4-cyclodiphosphate synthase [Phycisphaerales bacterium]|nr:2-C-methyl-D-erythritol 2,4-cyclodiphosphate synthase [Phycisphaerales bacterium]